MTALRDELAQLTSDQPTQPGDRLMSVTARAHRIRRTRSVIAAAALIAVAVPVGVALGTRDGSSRPDVIASEVADWPDRSTQADRAIAAGALAQWTDEGGDPTDLRWLYRGSVKDPDLMTAYAAVWVADGKVVAAFAPQDYLDADGRPTNKDVHWLLSSMAADRVPSVLSLYFDDSRRGDSNFVLLLADPAARTLRWTTTPLLSAPTTGIAGSGRLTSSNGVFEGWIGPLAGRLSVTVDELPGDALPLTFPAGEPLLAKAPAPSTGGHRVLSRGSETSGDDSPGIDIGEYDRAGAVRIRCYGGGAVTVLFDEKAVGSAACDLTEQVVTLAGTPGKHALRLRGNRWQPISWAVVEATR